MPLKDPEKKQAWDLRNRRRHAARVASGTCTRCGLCGIPHKPHDGNVLVMLSIVKNLQVSNKLTVSHIT